MKLCNLLLLGCGQFGKKRLSASTTVEGTNVVAVYDSKHESARQLSLINNSKALEKFEDISKVDYDGVILSTSNDSHLNLCQYFLKQNKYILCEAPLVKSLDQLDTLRCIDERSLSLIKPATPILYHPAVEELIKYLSNRTLGRIYTVKISLGHNQEDTKFNWKSDPAISGGGALMELGPNVLSLVNLFGKVKDFSVNTKRFSKECEVDDYAFGHFELENGPLIHFETDWNKWTNSENIIVEGELGILKVPLHSSHLLLTSKDGETMRIPIKKHGDELEKEIYDFTQHIYNKKSFLNSLSEQIYILPTILRKAS